MITAGFGFRTTASADSLRNALAKAARGTTINAIATAEAKAGTEAFQDIALALDLAVHAVPQADLAAQTPFTYSNASMTTYGTGSVAEASALAAAGPGAELMGPRVISDDGQATCALAQRTDP